MALRLTYLPGGAGLGDRVRPRGPDLDVWRPKEHELCDLLVGTADRVYARSDDTKATDAAVRVPGYEEAAVHQLIARGWLTTGNGQHRVTCGAAQLIGTAVLAPRSTRNRIARWEALARPTSWQPDTGHANRTRR